MRIRLALTLFVLAGCSTGAPVESSSGGGGAAACEGMTCPAGAFEPSAAAGCVAPETVTTCCSGGIEIHACTYADAGILTNMCPGCDGGYVCAVLDGIVTCNIFDVAPGP
jgi:hypothetical protein